jgi:hypothetical protein
MRLEGRSANYRFFPFGGGFLGGGGFRGAAGRFGPAP